MTLAGNIRMVLGFLFLSVLPRCSFSFPFLFYFLVNETFSHLFDPEMLSERTCTHGPVCMTRAWRGTGGWGCHRPPWERGLTLPVQSGPQALLLDKGSMAPPSRLSRWQETQDPTPRDSGKGPTFASQQGRGTPASPGKGERTSSCLLSEATGPQPHLAEGEDAARLARYGPQKEGKRAASQLERGNEAPALPG